jgi:hypothetical protein
LHVKKKRAVIGFISRVTLDTPLCEWSSFLTSNVIFQQIFKKKLFVVLNFLKWLFLKIREHKTQNATGSNKCSKIANS